MEKLFLLCFHCFKTSKFTFKQFDTVQQWMFQEKKNVCIKSKYALFLTLTTAKNLVSSKQLIRLVECTKKSL